MIALSTYPTVDTALANGTGAAEGTTFAVPQRTRQSTLVVTIDYDGDPGAVVFFIEASLDNVTFVLVGTTITATSDPVTRSVPDFGYRFVRVGRVSQANSVNDTVTLVLT